MPEPEPVKVRAETRTARLQFRQDSYRILPGYKDNRSELDTVSHSIQLVEDNEDISITGIFITGYASPEGSEELNERIARQRAEAVQKMLVNKYGISKERIVAEGQGIGYMFEEPDWNRVSICTINED